ncbi:MAG: WG repeat-containing protein [bacterium]|nr:WG repeat-containing protein [bacterium]
MANQDSKQKFCGDSGMFYDGLTVAEVNGEWYHILKDGTPAYPERYQKTEYFQHGLAWVKKEGKWIRINKQGKEVIV